MDQIVIQDKDGNFSHIELHPKMNQEQLRKKMGAHDVDKVWAHFDECHTQAYSELIQASYPESNMDSLDTVEPGEHIFPAQIKCEFSDHYYRAYAKIAFHHFLNHTKRGYSGSEEIFAPLRNFIMDGGDKKQFFEGLRDRFRTPLGVMPDGRLRTSARWHHLLAIDESGTEIVVYAQLFVGPKGIRPAHMIRLAKNSKAILAPSFVWGHIFTYGEEQLGQYAGKVEPLSITRPDQLVVPKL